MSEYLIQSGTLGAIADAIRAKKGTTNTMTPAQMADEIAGISGVENVAWHQCPEAVRNYLAAAQAAYPSDDTVTVIDQYAPSHGNENLANTKPVGYTVDGVTFYDNEPLVAEPFSTANKAGTLTALDALRWYNTTPTTPADGSIYNRGRNCRDLGGWACDGGTVKYGMLIRGSEPNPADKALMVDKIGVKTEVQLLPVREQPTYYKMKSPWGIDWAGNTTENDSAYGLENTHVWKLILSAIFDSVIHDKPVYFHCGVGADRTGVIAMMILAILGVSRSDVDIDYELTNFDAGWQSLSGGIFRSRTYSTYQSLMAAWDAIPLADGLTDSFQNRSISFVLSLGITAEEINAFRAACIDGTPSTITPTIRTYTITKTLTNVTLDNSSASATQYQSYNAGVKPLSGYAISGISVVMGGVDITNSVFSGTETMFRFSVTNTLTNCSSNNTKISVVKGEGYGATITADDGYTLDGAAVSITMGGVNMSNYYSDGKIAIPSVTGDLVINVSAVASASAYTNLADPTDAYWKTDERLSLSGGGTVALAGHVVTNFIPAKKGDILRVKGMQITSNNSTSGGSAYKICGYSVKDDEASHVCGLYGANESNNGYNTKVSTAGTVSEYQLMLNDSDVQKASDTMQYIRVDGALLSGYTANDVIITINEEIV